MESFAILIRMPRAGARGGFTAGTVQSMGDSPGNPRNGSYLGA